MKLLQAVIRFCAVGIAPGRGGVAVPHDFRVTVPAPLNQAQAAEAGALDERSPAALHATNQHRNTATVLAPQH